MDINQQKEKFSDAYLQAVASVAGYSLYKPNVDDDSVDWGIAASGKTGRIRAPRLELQLKCTSTDILEDSYVKYPLKIKNYNDLRMSDLAVPRILVVVLVRENLREWLQHSQQELCMISCGYWMSLRGLPETENLRTVTVSLPINNQFSVEKLHSIMQLLSQGDKL
jgi:hypothetical protein